MSYATYMDKCKNSILPVKMLKVIGAAFLGVGLPWIVLSLIMFVPLGDAKEWFSIYEAFVSLMISCVLTGIGVFLMKWWPSPTGYFIRRFVICSSSAFVLFGLFLIAAGLRLGSRSSEVVAPLAPGVEWRVVSSEGSRAATNGDLEFGPGGGAIVVCGLMLVGGAGFVFMGVRLGWESIAAMRPRDS